MKKKKKKEKAEVSLESNEKAIFKVRKKISVHNVMLLILVSIALLLRIHCTIFDFLIDPDSCQYLRLAKEIKSGEFFQKDYALSDGLLKSRRVPFFYSFILAGFSFIFSDLELFAHLLSIFFSLVLFIPVYRFGKKIESKTASLLAIAFLSTNPLILRYASAILTEPVFSLISVSLCWLGLFQLSKARLSLSFLGGALSAIAYCTREAGIALFVILFSLSIVFWLFIKRVPTKKIIALCSAIVSGFIIFAFPFWLHIRVHSGKWALSAQVEPDELLREIMHYGGNRKERDEIPGTITLDQNTRFEGGEDVRGPGIIKKVIFLGASYLFTYFKFLGWVSLVGIVIHYAFIFFRYFYPESFLKLKNSTQDRNAREKLFEEFYIFCWIFHLIIFYALLTPYMVDERYIYPALPLGMVLASSGWVKLLTLVRDFIIKRWRSSFATIEFFLVLVFVLNFGLHLKNFIWVWNFFSDENIYRKYGAGAKEIAEEFKERGIVTEGKVFLDRKPFVAYYLGGRMMFIPKTYSELLQIIKLGVADYLVADTNTLLASRPLLIELAIGYQPPQTTKAYEKDGKIVLLKDPKAVIREPMAGTSIVYSRYFENYKRVITIYDLKPEKEVPEDKFSKEEIKLRALSSFADGYLYQAINYSKRILDMDPADELALSIIVKSYIKYYEVINKEFVLVDAIKYARQLLELAPDDEEATKAYSFLKKEQEKWSEYKSEFLKKLNEN